MARPNHLVRALLNRIPETQRKDAVRDVIKVVDSQNLRTVEFALDVLSACPDEGSKVEFVERLKHFILAGHLDVAIFACRYDEGIKDELLTYTLTQLRLLGSTIRRCPQKLVAERSGDHLTLRSDDERTVGLESLNLTNKHHLTLLQPLLTCLKMLVEPETNSEHTNVILETVLPLLGICEEQIALAAQDVVYKFLKSRKVLSDSEMTSIWAGVRNLIDSGLTTFHANLGYDIWLRCINFTLDRIQLWFETEYWRLLRSGLQTGDGERRKKCLEIIRCSVIVAAKESTLRQQICSRAIGDECE